MTRSTVSIATEATWDFMEDEDLVKAITSAARKVAAYRPDSSEEDLYQDGLLYVAVRPELVEHHPRRVYADVYRHLTREDIKARKVEFANSGSTAEEWEEDMGLYNSGMQADPFADMAYPERLVETLLEGMWNGWVVTDEFRPDSDMPRAKPNPSRLGTDIAHRIDVERAWGWAQTQLSQQARVALQLTLGQGLTQEAASVGMGIDRSNVSRHVETGLRLLCEHLNGMEGKT